MQATDGSLRIHKENVSNSLVVALFIVSVHGALVLLGVEIPTFGIHSIESFVATEIYQLQVIFWIHVFSIIFSALLPVEHSSVTNSFIAGVHVVVGGLYLFTAAPMYGLVMSMNGFGMVANEYRKIDVSSEP